MTDDKQKEYIQKIKQTLTLLFVEDEEMVKEASLKSLRRRFKEIYTASDGKGGLELYIKFKPDIVLTDLLMPKHDGLELIKHIREIDKTVPIVVISAISDEASLKMAKKYIIQGYFIKPINEDQFLDHLYRLSVELL
ncbi:MAG: response regulator [Nitrospirae bacterium]|nr:response regulator [Nitrospirota bacterium]